ncbi:MAG: FecR family protein [Deltaproteobacteria bacterium]|jgi:hypothetical protein|nr:FecR family protein [Deltaproteobacteria bacterium]
MRSFNRYFSLLLIALLASLALTSPARAQNEAPQITSIAGKAQILSRGRRTPAKEGQKLAPGDTIELIGGGEVQLSVSDGQINVKVLGGSKVKYDGAVSRNALPWSPLGQLKTAADGPGETPQLSIPVGQVEVSVQPGQNLRLVAPLILAAVRGTDFSVAVELDGTSRINTRQGQVETYGRNGELKLTGPGQSAILTSREYTAYLAASGVNIPAGGSWKNVPATTQERVDRETLGEVFSAEGGGFLAAVLANPNLSPSAGVNAIIMETTETSEAGPSPLQTAHLAQTGQAAVQAETAVYVPDNSIVDLAVNDVTQPAMPPGLNGPKAHVIGWFTFPTTLFPSQQVVSNSMGFTIDLETLRIFNAFFDIDIRYTVGVNTKESSLSAFRGTGSIDPNTFNYTISGFPSTAMTYYNEFQEETFGGGTVSGYFGPATVMTGFLSSSGTVDYGDSTMGSLNLDYVVTSGGPLTLPTSFGFNGGVADKPLLYMEGTFNIPTGMVATQNSFNFNIDRYNSRIFDGSVDVIYNNGLPSGFEDEVDIYLHGGSGSFSGSTFTINLPNGNLDFKVGGSSGGMFPATGVLTVNMANPNQEPGNQATSGQVIITPTSPIPNPPVPPALVPPSLSVHDGRIKDWPQ